MENYTLSFKKKYISPYVSQFESYFFIQKHSRKVVFPAGFHISNLKLINFGKKSKMTILQSKNVVLEFYSCQNVLIQDWHLN